MKRVFDFFLALFLASAAALPMAFIAVLVKLTSPGPALYLSNRIGKDNRVFKMYKFRTMKLDAPAVATHLMKNPEKYITPIGSFMRKTSLDELPQLFNILQGTMSFVGPRPALFNQDDLIALRTKKGVHTIITGITGWAQVNGRDDLPILVKVSFDEYYQHHRSFLLDLAILRLTVRNVLLKKGITH